MGIDSEDDDVLYSANMGYDTQNRALIGGEAKNLDEIMNKPRDRMKKTLGLCAAFVGLGLSVAVLGPTLRSLKVQVGASSMENMAIVFSGRGLGYLGGTIAGGAFFECWNSQVLIAVGLGLASFGMAIVAFTKHLPILVIMMSGVGIAMGVLDTGANVVCIKMWGKKASAFLQMLHFGFALGAFLAPLLATPFLRGDLAVNPNISCVVETEQHLDLCEKYICDHGGHCKINDNGKATCTCTEGFTGEHCTDIKCSDDGYAPCKNGGTCIPKEGETKASCQCPGGFTGVICDEQKQCETNLCKNGGNCTIGKDEKEICSCTGGFTGEHCEEHKQCNKTTCANDGTCNVEDDGTETCTCKVPFTGVNCTEEEHCKEDACQNGGTCNIGSNNEETCACPEGFTGEHCEAELCKKKCQNGGLCQVKKDKKETCHCLDGFTGEDCGDIECSDDGGTPCKNGGTCIPKGENQKASCKCQDGFTGVLCDAIQCIGNVPCLNNGTCVSKDEDNTTMCECVAGFTGELCEAINCTVSPCLHHGMCVPETATEPAMCNCTEGFTGQFCESIDCNGTSPCLHNGECIPGKNNTEDAMCKCKPGFTGDVCQTIDCDGSPCLNSGICIPPAISLEKRGCLCPHGLVGDICDVVNCSRGNPCLHGGDCVTKQDEENEYECKCTVGFTGVVCEECKSSYCQNGGTCTVIEDEVICTCRVGFTGDLCQECDTNYCRHDGKCKIVDNEVYCICKNDTLGDHCEKKCVTQDSAEVCKCVLGFTGEHCDECDPNYCQNGGNITCIVQTDEVTCDCAPGFTGDRCEAIDCSSSPCLHDGKCVNKTNTEEAKCECTDGYNGFICEECDADYCQNGGTCGITGDKVMCTCEAGFTGEVCDKCDADYCQNGGTCGITGDKVTCTCEAGFTGEVCDSPVNTGRRKRRDTTLNLSHQKRAIDCSTSPCLHDGTCHTETEDHSCECKGGFTGETCEECDPAYCQNGGSCYIEDDGQVMCKCTAGFTGEVCDAIDCSASPCLHGTECVPEGGNTEAYCNCTEGLSGFICEKCDENYCQNGGTCKVNENDKVECTCPGGFTGNQCKGCDKKYCKNEGKCGIQDGTVICTCKDGYTGEQCEGCAISNCLHGGTCTAAGKEKTCSCPTGFTGKTCELIDCDHSPCLNNGNCSQAKKEGKVNTCVCAAGFTGDICEEKVAPTGFRGVYIIISLYLASICVLFCYFTYISPIASEATTQQKASSDRPSYENQILMLLFCFYLIYVGSEVSFGGYISEYYQAVFKDCHGSLATAWFWGTFSLGRGLAICFATVMTPMKMLVADLAGGVIATVILLWVGDVSMWFWVGTGLLGLSMASMFPAGIAWLEGYVDVSGKVASVLVTGGVLGEMLIPLTVGYVMFDKKEGLEEQVYPDRLMYLMCGVCIGSSLIFGYVYMLARDMGLKNTHTNQHSVTDVIDGMNDAFSMRNMNTKGPKQMKKSMKFGKKHKV